MVTQMYMLIMYLIDNNVILRQRLHGQFNYVVFIVSFGEQSIPLLLFP